MVRVCFVESSERVPLLCEQCLSKLRNSTLLTEQWDTATETLADKPPVAPGPSLQRWGTRIGSRNRFPQG